MLLWCITFPFLTCTFRSPSLLTTSSRRVRRALATSLAILYRVSIELNCVTSQLRVSVTVVIQRQTVELRRCPNNVWCKNNLGLILIQKRTALSTHIDVGLCNFHVIRTAVSKKNDRDWHTDEVLISICETQPRCDRTRSSWVEKHSIAVTSVVTKLSEHWCKDKKESKMLSKAGLHLRFNFHTVRVTPKRAWFSRQMKFYFREPISAAWLLPAFVTPHILFTSFSLQVPSVRTVVCHIKQIKWSLWLMFWRSWRCIGAAAQQTDPKKIRSFALL